MHSTDTTTALCQAVMRGVAASGVVTDVDAACAVMRAEVKAFLFEAEYAAERAAVISRSVSESTVVASLVAACVLKINARKVQA